VNSLEVIINFSRFFLLFVVLVLAVFTMLFLFYFRATYIIPIFSVLFLKGFED